MLLTVKKQKVNMHLWKDLVNYIKGQVDYRIY